MSTATATQNVFKSFLVEGGRDSKIVYRVIEASHDISRQKIEMLLENFPVWLDLRKEFSATDALREPIEVYVSSSIISIYPPRHRVLAHVTFPSSKFVPVVKEMHIDNAPDMVFPGHGQIRTCVHFEPKLFGIDTWVDGHSSMEIDIHVFPKDKTSEPQLKAPTFGKRDVLKLLELIAGGDRQLTIEQLKQWRELITYAVKSMRSCYENPDIAEDYPVRVYYKPCWTKIEAAGQDDEKLLEALDNLRGKIQWE